MTSVEDAVATVWSKGHGCWHIPVANVERFSDRCRTLDRQGIDCYVGIAPREAIESSSERGTKEQCIALPALFVDIDIGGGVGHAAGNLPSSVEDALELVIETAPVPSLVVQSGGGLHAYWLLDDPPIFGPGYPVAAQLAEGALRTLCTRVGDAFQTRGWHFDRGVGELTRVLRVPGTRNFKLAGKPRACTILDDSGPRYSWTEIRQLLGASSGPAASNPAPGQSPPAVASPPGDAGSLEAPSQPPPARDFVFAHIRRELLRLTDPKKQHRSAALARVILDGAPLAAPGKRDETLQRAASLVSFVSPARSLPEDIVEILRPAIDAMAAQGNDAANPAPSMDDALAKVSRAAAKKEAQRTSLNPVRAALLGDHVEHDEPAIAGLAAEMGCTPAELDKRWIIQHDTAFYVLGPDGRYKSPITPIALDGSLPRDLAAAPINWTTGLANGRSRRKTAKEIILEHGTVARRVIADLTTSVSRYDAQTETFFEAVAPLRDLEPRFDERIDHWLRLLGGVDAEKLLDWVATVSELSLQSAALYLEGEHSAGKGMLAAGLARLWRTAGGPTLLENIVGAWTADIAQCPFVWADEYLPPGVTQARLRAMVGSSQFELTRKFLPNAPVRGAIRLLLTANRSDMLALGDQDLTLQEIDASAGRFLHIHVTSAPREYLAAIGGRTATEGWVDQDLIARHALALRARRQVQPGTRFLVEGHTTAMHRKLATQSKTAGLIVEWLARFLDDNPNTPGGPELQGLVRVGSGMLLVNTLAISKFWKSYIDSDDVPTTTRIGKTLKSWSGGRPWRIGARRFHNVPVDIVLGWARENHIGDETAMRRRLAREVDMRDAVEENEGTPEGSGLPM